MSSPPENSKIGNALAKMEKDKLPNFLFREALIFGTVFQVWSKMAGDEKKVEDTCLEKRFFSFLDNPKVHIPDIIKLVCQKIRISIFFFYLS